VIAGLPIPFSRGPSTLMSDRLPALLLARDDRNHSYPLTRRSPDMGQTPIRAISMA
jgi:hypothetical protein